ncbi:MAG: hypothetical protein U9R53_12300 [Chloroflexota bacterium]|nr:hypothetical protein [Chloroflexota bacterium]
MENENEEALNGESNSEKNFHQEDIPLWLQGIEDSQDEDTIPLKKASDVPDQWVKEVPEDIGDKLSSLDNTEDSPGKEEDIPDWIDDEPESLSERTSDFDDIEYEVKEVEESPIEHEDNDLIDSDMVKVSLGENLIPDENSELIENSFEVVPPEEEFIEISEADMSNEEQPNRDGKSSEDEELPYWLQEMIAEPSDNVSAEKHAEAEKIEEYLEEAKGLESDIDEDIVLEEAHPSQDLVQDIGELKISKVESRLHNLSEWMAEEDTKPVPIQPETPIETEIPVLDEEEKEERVEEIEQVHQVEMPEELQNAKVLMDEGEYSQAIDAIISCQEKKAYHDDIRSWLMTAVQGDAKGNCEVWETIGDIELSEANPEDALNAYKKAIHFLLANEKEIDEID